MALILAPRKDGSRRRVLSVEPEDGCFDLGESDGSRKIRGAAEFVDPGGPWRCLREWSVAMEGKPRTRWSNRRFASQKREADQAPNAQINDRIIDKSIERATETEID